MRSWSQGFSCLEVKFDTGAEKLLWYLVNPRRNTILSFTQKYPTLLGYLALIMWSTGATNACFLRDIPTFQVLGLVFLVSCIVSFVSLVKNKAWHQLKVPSKTYLLIFCGAGLQQLFYIFAFSKAPPVEADIIIYLWPVLAVLLCALFFKDKIRPRYWLAVVLGLASVVLPSISKLSEANSLSLNSGHLFAFLCAVCWASYSAFAQRMRGINLYTVGLVYAVMACLCFGYMLWAQIPFVWLTPSQTAVLIFYSFVVMFALQLWTKGMQFGKAKQLTVSSYLKPVISILLLYIFGLTELSLPLMVAVVLVALSGLIAQGGILEIASIVVSQNRGLGLEFGHKHRKNPIGYAVFAIVSFASTFKDLFGSSAPLTFFVL